MNNMQSALYRAILEALETPEEKRKRIIKTTFQYIVVIVLVIAFYAFLSLMFMLLWNYVIAYIFDVKQINFWIGAGAVALLSLVGSFFRK